MRRWKEEVSTEECKELMHSLIRHHGSDAVIFRRVERYGFYKYDTRERERERGGEGGRERR